MIVRTMCVSGVNMRFGTVSSRLSRVLLTGVAPTIDLDVHLEDRRMANELIDCSERHLWKVDPVFYDIIECTIAIEGEGDNLSHRPLLWEPPRV